MTNQTALIERQVVVLMRLSTLEEIMERTSGSEFALALEEYNLLKTEAAQLHEDRYKIHIEENPKNFIQKLFRM